jgi:VIT1/CCC1 family predicted Fe2+/Mn2+ transporter
MNYHHHFGNERAYMRDIILGINDGLISTFLLTIGVYASGLSWSSILLTIISCAISGSISMALGEYLATKSQIEVTNAEIEIEKTHIEKHLDVELNQVRDFLVLDLNINDNPILVENFVNTLSNNKEGLLNFMKKIEFGITEDDQRTPLTAMLVSGGLFFIGSIPSIISFSITRNIKLAFYINIVLNLVALFVVGAVKTIMTRTNLCSAGLENLTYGCTGAFISYGIGYGFGILIKMI